MRVNSGRRRHTVVQPGALCMLVAIQCFVLGFRLYLDHKPSAYLIHSIIVFFDMILIHIFSNSRWLSVLAGEIKTYLLVLFFTLTKETVFELVETTAIAVLCSFHLIGARSQVMAERSALQKDLREYERRGSVLLQNLALVQQEFIDQSVLLREDLEVGGGDDEESGSVVATEESDSTLGEL